jgi:hypothetical protein
MGTEAGMLFSWGLKAFANNEQKDRLDTSGIDVVLTTSLYAIIGAIALQKGGDVAARVARERVLKPLGIS